MRIDLQIQRLVLEGLPVEPGQRPVLLSAIEAELTRLLAASELRSDLLSSGRARSIIAGEIQLTNQFSAERMGGDIARAVHGGISAPSQETKHR